MIGSISRLSPRVWAPELVQGGGLSNAQKAAILLVLSDASRELEAVKSRLLLPVLIEYQPLSFQTSEALNALTELQTMLAPSSDDPIDCAFGSADDVSIGVAVDAVISKFDLLSQEIARISPTVCGSTTRGVVAALVSISGAVLLALMALGTLHAPVWARVLAASAVVAGGCGACGMSGQVNYAGLAADARKRLDDAMVALKEMRIDSVEPAPMEITRRDSTGRVQTLAEAPLSITAPLLKNTLSGIVPSSLA